MSTMNALPMKKPLAPTTPKVEAKIVLLLKPAEKQTLLLFAEIFTNQILQHEESYRVCPNIHKRSEQFLDRRPRKIHKRVC